MNDDFLLVHKSILPSLLPQVIEAREKIQKDGISVTEACKSVNISRSAFYKYKDFVFFPDTSVSKKAILAFKVNDKPGVLTALLAKLSQAKINVLTNPSGNADSSHCLYHDDIRHQESDIGG